MAEPCNVAFGRYLKALRERRGLSLDEVQSLSQVFPEPIGKTYLSRCENGRQKLAFSKMIPLSRIYEVPPEVLVERMELDLELDRIGGPDTEAVSFAQSIREAKAASARGHFWDSYGFFRDAMKVARESPVVMGNDADEQFVCATMSCAIAATRLGAKNLALYEYEHIRRSKGLGRDNRINLYLLLSQEYRRRGDLSRAIRLSRRALDAAEKSDSVARRAFAHHNAALLHYFEAEYDQAVEHFKISFSLHKSAGLIDEQVRTLLNLAQVYFESNRRASATRALGAAERLATRHDLDRSRALARILKGELAVKEGHPTRAVRYWRESIDFSKKARDRVTRFKAEFQLYKHALDSDDRDTARSLERILKRRALWVPEDVEELAEFRSMTGTKDLYPFRSVSVPQR